jgi:esterase FrsA
VTETRTLADGRDWLLQRLERRIHPLDGIDADHARAVIGHLAGLDPESWTDAWGGLAAQCVAEAEAAERVDDLEAARDAWWQAYQAAFLGRYPIPNHPLKQRSYEQAREYFVKATALDAPPVEVVTVPFDGREGEGRHVRFYLVRPVGVQRPPVVMAWAGIDTWKEEMYERMGRLLADRGYAAILIDMPGVGESPVLAGTDSERQWDPVFDWVDSRDDLDGSRIGVIGGSFGGYWAMKLAHTHRARLRCAVNWGGGVHITFTPEWQEKSRNASSYLIDLMAARAGLFGGSTFEDYVARCQELSLLDQGILDRPSAPLLLTNGRNDVQNSIDDIYLSLDHGSPKAARVFDGGHMGEGPVVPTIIEWVDSQLRAS